MDSSRILNFSKILTNRLIIRKLKNSDAAAIYTLRANQENRKYIDRPLMGKLDEAKEFIKRMNTGIIENEWLYWGICLKGKDEIIGTICLWHFSDEPRKAEIGYELLPEFQGKGFMNEAVIAIVDYGFRVLKLECMEACTSRDNVNSISLLEKNKFNLVRELSKEELQCHEKDLGLCLYRYIPQ
jgi:RimJ/RimL family protein N-acetyltransferase